uniref:Uncharacterized protein n=1 Tax=Nelumbo nucifera TaxID=4432 RepID=A0A822ZA53_NELNU|nr:TPA_asm: hypothetical protein HUJ06_015766 [Nelumbo nucifera]
MVLVWATFGDIKGHVLPDASWRLLYQHLQSISSGSSSSS